MEEIDKYLAELSEVYAYDSFSRISLENVINRLLEIRNSLPKTKGREIVIDGDELSKYFRGNRYKKDEELDD